MRKDELKKHIDRAGDILAKAAKRYQKTLPSIKAEAETMKEELRKVGTLDKAFRERSKEVLEVFKKRKKRP